MNAVAPKKGYTEEEKKKPLYCIAYTWWSIKRKKWVAEKLYMHADSAGDARVMFMNSEAPETHRRINIVGVAPVIGYFVHDNHGDKLSV